jgi:hypothetical protein
MFRRFLREFSVRTQTRDIKSPWERKSVHRREPSDREIVLEQEERLVDRERTADGGPERRGCGLQTDWA